MQRDAQILEDAKLFYRRATGRSCPVSLLPGIAPCDEPREFNINAMPEIIVKSNTNYNERPAPADGIIIHAAASQIDGKPAHRFIAENNLSYHALIHPDGTIYNTVSYEKRAWHAGTSRLGEQTDLNGTFIGVCFLVEAEPGWGAFLEAIARPESYTDDHYESGIFLVNSLMTMFEGVQPDRIVGHSDVSGADVRPDPKPDPGPGFDMTRLKLGVRRKFTADLM